MATYALRPRNVEAFQLTVDNWKWLTDMVSGRFTQHVVVDRAWGTKVDDSGYLQWAGEIARMGDYVVNEGSGNWVSWKRADFENSFQQTDRPIIMLEPR